MAGDVLRRGRWRDRQNRDGMAVGEEALGQVRADKPAPPVMRMRFAMRQGIFSSGVELAIHDDVGEVEEGVDDDAGPEIGGAFVDVAEGDGQYQDGRGGPEGVDEGEEDGRDEDGEPGFFEGVAEDGLEVAAEEGFFGQRGDDDGGEDDEGGEGFGGIVAEDFEKLVGLGVIVVDAIPEPFGEIVGGQDEGENDEEPENCGDDGPGEAGEIDAEAAGALLADDEGGRR